MANEACIWFPYHIKDIRSETYNMSRIEKSAYIDLLEMLWERDGSIPADDKWIAIELGMKPREWTAMRDRVLRQFVSANGCLSHPRFTVELEKAKANVEQKRRAGIASAEARKSQRAFNGRSTGVPTADPTERQRDTQRLGNGSATARQPRAGGGGGGGNPIPIHEGELEGGYGVCDGNPFRFAAGGE
jgi:uncharacterized protein YdaU (DUF1376 family)